jgi:SMC interacting uncharacterized protein involved in chromosome segregation
MYHKNQSREASMSQDQDKHEHEHQPPIQPFGDTEAININLNVNINISQKADASLMQLISEVFKQLTQQNKVLLETEKNTMSAITDLQAKFDAAVATLKQTLTDAATALDALAAKVGSTTDPAELAALSADISAQSDALTQQAASLEQTIATDNPPAAAAGAPTPNVQR